MKHPKEIILTEAQIDTLRSTIQTLEIDALLKTILTGLLDNHIWLQHELHEKKISMSRLKSYFGIKSEKHAKASSNDKEMPSSEDETDDGGDSGGTSALKLKPKPSNPNKTTEKTATSASKKKGHGRYAADDYTGAQVVTRTLDALSQGGPCPDTACDGRVYKKSVPGVAPRITGGSMIQATRYNLERYRCNLCLATYTASLPDDVSIKDKYDAKAKAVVAIDRIQLGVAMYRRAGFQKQLGLPLAESTQWGLTKIVDGIARPVFDYLVKTAAQGSLFYIDDTWVRILAIIKANKEATCKKDKKGMHTTGLISHVNGRRIILYFTGVSHAGQNLNKVLKHRKKGLKIPIQMNDALACNNSEDLCVKTIDCHCTTHGRRKFIEIKHYYPSICNSVLDAISELYNNESYTKEKHMTDYERLLYHKEYSQPIMDNLKKFMLEHIKFINDLRE